MSRMCDPFPVLREWEERFSALVDADRPLQIAAWGYAVKSNAPLQLAAQKKISVSEAAELLLALPAPNDALLPWRLEENGMLLSDWTDAFADGIADGLAACAKDVCMESSEAPFFYPCAALHRAMRRTDRAPVLDKAAVMAAALDTFTLRGKKDVLQRRTEELNRRLDEGSDRTTVALAGALTLLLRKKDTEETILWRNNV